MLKTMENDWFRCGIFLQLLLSYTYIVFPVMLGNVINFPHGWFIAPIKMVMTCGWFHLGMVYCFTKNILVVFVGFFQFFFRSSGTKPSQPFAVQS